MKLSVLIKTFNEAKKIGPCLESVLAATAAYRDDTEIVVADSLSTDQTVELAKAYPVRVVQLVHPGDRGCGAGVQLGFQYALGEFIYLLDGDMQVQPGFISQALAVLQSDSKLAGVAGLLEDTEVRNWFDRHRVKNRPAAIAGNADWLAGGGLYRRQAIKDAGGYAGDRNLKAYEEADLGLRLKSLGWRLVRLPILAVRHTGHQASTFDVILSLWSSGRAAAGGVLLKSAIGRPWLFRCVRMFLHPLGVLAYWLTGFVSLFIAPWLLLVWALVGLTVFVALLIRKTSFVDAGLSVLLWHMVAVGIIVGMGRARLPPEQPIESIEVYNASTTATSS